MLNFSHTLIVLSLLFVFVASERCFQFLVKVTLCEWVKNPYIIKCTLPPLPKTTSTDIQTSASSDEFALLVRTSPVKI